VSDGTLHGNEWLHDCAQIVARGLRILSVRSRDCVACVLGAHYVSARIITNELGPTRHCPMNRIHEGVVCLTSLAIYAGDEVKLSFEAA
jgi:hypothetical protein